jgi:hypothetical protein
MDLVILAIKVAYWFQTGTYKWVYVLLTYLSNWLSQVKIK